MNSKRTGVSFLLQMIVQYSVIIGLTVYYLKGPSAEEISITANLILSQLMNLAPVLPVVLIGWKKQQSEKLLGDILGFRRIKPTTALMTVLYTFLVMPLSTLANVVSMIFVDNTVAEIAGDVLNVPFFLMFPIMAVFGPLCEETVFRGAFYRGFRKSGNIFGAVILSALLFGMMHMNFNQAGYAFLLGIMMALAAEATGSVLTPFLMHFLFNGMSVCLMYLQNSILPEEFLEQMENYNPTAEEVTLYISVYLFLAVVSTAIAFCVLTWMASNEGKQNFLRTVWESRKIRKEKLWSIWLVLGTILSVLYMLFDAFAKYLVPYILKTATK